jgi:hypothetical protein
VVKAKAAAAQRRRWLVRDAASPGRRMRQRYGRLNRSLICVRGLHDRGQTSKRSEASTDGARLPHEGAGRACRAKLGRAGERPQSQKYAAAATHSEEERVARSDNRGGIAGISVGGIIVIVGIVLMFVWSFWLGLIIALVGLIAFGGFARGKWY